MALSGLWSRLTGGIFGVGVGVAAADAMTPVIEPARQTAWENNPFRVLDVGTLAELVAQGLIDQPTAEGEALRDGYAAFRTDGVVQSKLTAPGVGELLTMLNRKTANGGNVSHAFRKQKLEPMWDAPLLDLANQKIPVPDLAFMMVRDILASPFGYDGPTSPTDNAINDVPTLSIDPVAEAAAQGWDKTRLEALYGRSGLAPAPVTAANAYFRGLATYTDFLTMIKKGDLRPAYANVVLNTARQILTAGEYAELELRGFLTTAQRQKATDQHGMSLTDSDNLYNVLGRAINPHQVTIGLARGGKYTGNPTTAPSPYLESLQRGNVRPEWYDLAFHAEQYSYPSAFVFRQLLRDGAITQAQGQQYFLEIGWPPALAQAVSQAYGTTSSTADPHVGKAQTQLWGTTHKSYVASEIDDPTATTALSAAGVGAAAVPAVLSLWGEERSLIRKQLSPAQVKKAYSEGVQNPATGAPWSLSDATAALLARGYDQADAVTLLEE